MYDPEEHYKIMLKMIEDESRRVNRMYYFAWFLFGLVVGTIIIVVGLVRFVNGA